MKLTFYGAAKAVTGSCHCLSCNGRKILIDCGLQQGKDEWDNSELEFAASLIDDVIVTHAHIDHTGRIPLLVKQGFRGRIFCTRVTGERPCQPPRRAAWYARWARLLCLFSGTGCFMGFHPPENITVSLHLPGCSCLF